ncbi:MAG: Lrp/AsnC family transcriptional regulator [Lachnospiraceae bacterium]|nr:Lrp/AsnC family transcriptional regulator [Lachnospiraceae bacterium]
MQNGGLDTLDQKILKLIKNNARLSYSEIAEQIGDISRVSVKNRIHAMEEKGIILGYKTVTDPTETGHGIKFFIETKSKRGKYTEVVDFLSSIDIIREVHTISGQCKIIAAGYAPDPASLHGYAHRMFKILDEMEAVEEFSFDQVTITHKDDGGIYNVGNDQIRKDKGDHK